MSNYTKATNFAAKDSLPSGNAGKIVKGTELDTEFNNLVVAIATKADLASPTFTGTPTAPTADSTSNSTQIATTAFVKSLGGRVVQAVTSTFNGTFSSTSTSFVPTGHFLNITPTSTASKILVIQSSKLFQPDEYQPSQNAYLTLFRDSNNLAASGASASFVQVSSGYANSIYASVSCTALDSPNTLSSITYSVQVKKAGSNATAIYEGYATLTALEIIV